MSGPPVGDGTADAGQPPEARLEARGLAYDAWMFLLLLVCLALVASVGVLLRLIDLAAGTRLLDGLVRLFELVGDL